MEEDDLRLAPRTKAADLLAWAEAEGRAPVAESAVRAVLALLELGESRMHDGWPELTSNAVEQLLYERLHLYVQPAPEQDPLAYGEAVRLLVDHQRAAKRLNAKRQERLHAEAEWQGEVAAGLLRRADLVTWPRLYAVLLCAHDVDLADKAAVREWLTAFRELAEEDRRAAFEALAAAGWLDEADEEGWGAARVLSVGMATDGARRLLEQGLMRRSYRNLAELTALGRPMPDELAGDFGAFEEAAVEAALDLFGEWTVPGLPRLLVAEFPDLAPEPGQEEIDAYLAQLPGE
ncbi:MULTISPECIES: hypothetical protein [Streptomycetaceae]|uniref:hypothetical protein n=1 Tax=Streptomycetaceae TaxID=2062 RepID=UPI000CDC1AB6|nr:hypothetical protein [Streptomyces sp. CB01881]AUY50359.1 hypothetical protein C2142_17070 [Streptomyces sp. CB01881]TYC73746.1 hypothetical protein EH183_17050 [Streptomyces sp. CB01881]